MVAKWALFLVVALPVLQNSGVVAFSSTRSLKPGAPLSSTVSSSELSSFLVRSRGMKRTTHASFKNGGSSSSASALSMVIDRMSNQCVAGIQQAQDLGHSIGLKTLRNEILFCGMIAKPERALLTLQKYKLDNVLEVEVAAIRNIQIKLPSSEFSKTPVDWDTTVKREALPFSDESRSVLTRACEIADRMESEIVRSEHVILSLMGYNNGDTITSVPIMDLLGDLPSLKQGSRETSGFRVTQFCQDLVNALPNTPVTGEDVIVRDRVVVGGGVGIGGTSTLYDVGVDMTQMALEGKLDMVFGRDKEIRSALRTLGRRRKNNPCLIGDPGVGKTAVAEGIAQVLANGIREIDQSAKENNPINKVKRKVASLLPNGNKNKGEESEAEMKKVACELPPCPTSLLGSRLINIELAGLVAGTSNRGDFEKKVKNLIKEASENNVILFVDEIHNLIGTGGGGDGAMNAANLLKPALARGDLRLLGATTTPEYRKYIEKDGALERRFQPLKIKEPTVYETLDILAAVSPKYEEFHGVEYTYNALMAATKLSNRYISDRFLPDKAIDLIDEAGSMVKMREEGENYVVTEDAIEEVIAEITGIPIGKLDTDEKSRLRNLEQELEKRIKGQNTAVRAVAKAIRRARSGMRDGKRPVSSLLFCGSTGVGKTELCKALAETYYGQEKDMIRIDMSEYMDRFSTSRLIGAPPGYVGYEEGGQLTEAVRRAPHSVILFDELEKAHQDVLNLLLQIMDEGTLTDGKGRTVSFKNNILVMTSNLGSREIAQAVQDENYVIDESKLTANVVKEALEEAMRPELLNRIDEIVVFAPLAYENLKDIAKNLIDDAVKRTKEDMNIELNVSSNIPEIVTREALKTASVYGARPIRRAVQRYLEDTMAEAIMNEFIDEGDSVIMNLKNPNSGKKIVEIKRSIDGESILIDIDEDAGISRDDMEMTAAFGDIPKLDDEPPKKDPGTFQ